MGLTEHSSSGAPGAGCSNALAFRLATFGGSGDRGVVQLRTGISMRELNQPVSQWDKHAQENHLCEKRTQGATEVGPCLTDAAPKDRSQRTARVLTAMMPPERMRRQSSRHSWPGGSIRTSMTATATTRILAQLPHLSREQTL